ncbi:class I SAM-dependent methyltransferase [Thermoactinospora rubra]|uniref:class I SAM-dependent methyltransferase n=1 Tax=Thermoactinospora rubra TaxID=1088767 RepID=UPI000A11898D|nr:class I SAM-dependent methyltransferase [Thermoactinospora rubra]
MGQELWSAGAAYEPYVGRWSRMVAAEFVRWLPVSPDRRWCDVGCGTGAITRTVLDLAAPRRVVGVDAAEGYLRHARFPLCRPDPLRALFTGAGLSGVRLSPIDVPTRFAGFDDFWTPFLGGQGPAPGYVMSLEEDRRATLRERLRARLPYDADGSIPLTARAWAVSGVRP